MAKDIRIKLVRSGIVRPRKHRLVLKGLGLAKLNQVVTRQDTDAVRGMIRKISHLVEVVE